MELTGYLGVSIYSFLILLYILFHEIRHSEKEMMSFRLFLTVLITTMFLIAFDIFSRCDGFSKPYYPFLNHLGNFLLFFFNLLLPSFWFLYVHNQVYQNDAKTKRYMVFFLLLNLLNAASVIVSQFAGWFYTIDSENIYHRGPFFAIPAAITVLLILMAGAMVLSNRKQMEKKQFSSLIFFPVPPLLCIILQLQIYGIPLMLNGTAFSLLIVFINIQYKGVSIDYLTGAYNRKAMDNYLKKKIAACRQNHSFSAILIDLDDFKDLNDTYGHDIGDEALIASVRLLRSCVREEGFLARYGGDEFCVILNTDSPKNLEQIIKEISDCFEHHNRICLHPYRLQCSMGYAIYDCGTGQSGEEFIRRIDKLMYGCKRERKKTYGA
ncbi:MAG: GGDEF domain-containing protein [Anaerofustis sp.]